MAAQQKQKHVMMMSTNSSSDSHVEPQQQQTKSALKFDIVAQCSTTKARVGRLQLPHYTVDTCMFMPVGTQGSVKGLTTKQLRDIGVQILLGNTYHLGEKPGLTRILNDDCSDHLHEFMKWDRAILTDSGGFQMVSLLDLADITEEGVTFQSPNDGSTMLLTPEQSMRIQNEIGADIMMALDDVVATTTVGPRVEEATHRTLRWIDRCIAAHKNTDRQNLFGIVQGGLDPRLRKLCLDGLIERDLPGYAIGGLSGGESKDDFWRTVDLCTDHLPRDKPRYCMGVGYPVDLVVCVALGVDMFDCVYPTRTARFGSALVSTGTLNLRSAQYANDFRPLDESVDCFVNRQYTRAYLHRIAGKESAGSILITYHNLAYMMKLSRDMREAIIKDQFPQFVRQFFSLQYPNGDYPQWCIDSLSKVGIDLHTSE